MVNLFHFVGGFLVFSLVVLGGVMMINDFATNYPQGNLTDDDFGEVYDTINATFDITSAVSNNTLGSDIDDTNAIESMTLGSFKAIKQVWQMFGVLGDILTAVQVKLGVPEFIVKIGLTLASLAIIFTIVLLVMGIGRQ